MPKIKIVPPSFNGDCWFVTLQYGFHSSAYAKCQTKTEAQQKAKEAKLIYQG